MENSNQTQESDVHSSEDTSARPLSSPQKKNIVVRFISKYPILFTEVMVLILVVTSAYIFLKSDVTKPPPPQPIPTPIPSPTPTPDPTANWETYVQQNFTLKYPSDWYVFRVVALGRADVIEYVISNKNQDYGLSLKPEDRHAIQIIIDVRPDQYNKISNTLRPLESNQKTRIGNVVYIKKSDTQIAGIPAIQYSIEQVYKNQLSSSDIILFQYGENFYKIQLVSGSTEGLTMYKDTFDRILSTFKFLSASSSATPTINP